MPSMKTMTVDQVHHRTSAFSSFFLSTFFTEKSTGAHSVPQFSVTQEPEEGNDLGDILPQKVSRGSAGTSAKPADGSLLQKEVSVTPKTDILRIREDKQIK